MKGGIGLTKTSCLFLSLCFFAIVVQGILLGRWLVDDSAISLAYARNLAKHGELVAQIGDSPVEGFSNPLWVFLLAPIQMLASYTVVLKSVSGLLLAWSCFRLATGFRNSPIDSLSASVATLFLVLQPSVIVWGFSGLENPLYLAAGVELLVRVCRKTSAVATNSDALGAGLAASCLALTRPEGVLYVPLYYVAGIIADRKTLTDRAVIYRSMLLPLCVFSVYLSFRWLYFGQLLPNTHTAKGGPTIRHAFYLVLLEPQVLAPIEDLSRALFGPYLKIWGGLLAATLVAIVWVRKKSGILLGSGIMCFAALVAFLLLPRDWMDENRFATLVFPPFYLATSYSVINLLNRPRRECLIAFLALVAAIGSIERIVYFAQYPPISIAEVEERSDRMFRWGQMLGLSRPKVLTADIGGALLRDDVKIVDLGMLTDRVIAETLGEGSPRLDTTRFHNYIFQHQKPDFLELRAYHSLIAQMDEDSRFREQYTPIREYIDLWIVDRCGQSVFSGDYVRKDLVDDKPEALKEMQKEAAQVYYPFSEPKQ